MKDRPLLDGAEAKFDAFIRERIMATGARGTELMGVLLAEAGTFQMVSDEIHLSERPFQAEAAEKYCRMVSIGTGLFCAIYKSSSLIGAWPMDAVETELTLDDSISTACLVRGENFAGTADFSGRPSFIFAKPLWIEGNIQGVYICGQYLDKAREEHGFEAVQQSILKTAAALDLDRRNAIDEFVRSIRTIAKRIHLLALNASILSAQAGVHGRGFAVVAKEISELADKTRQSSTEMEHLLGREKSTPQVERRRGGRRESR